MSGVATGMVSRAVNEVLAAAAGRVHRDDPALPRTGGPAGNAQLTAWVGLLLVPLFVAELVTLVSLDRLLSWHIAIGVLLIPPALLKTATTGWRIIRYYTGASAYHRSGPPPIVLRMLGPLVVLTTLAVLGTGVILIVVGPRATFTPLATMAGQRITWLTLHQASTIGWAVAMGLHVLGRLVPAVQLAVTPSRGMARHPGGRIRTIVFLGTLMTGSVAAVIVLSLARSWTGTDLHSLHPGTGP